MRLLALPDMNGRPTYWVNADHLALVTRQQTRGPDGIHLVAELKIDGMPLFKTPIGVFIEPAAADAAWDQFLTKLQHGE